MIQKNIDIIAISLLLLGAATYSTARNAAFDAFSPLRRIEIHRGWEVPRVAVPIPPEPPRLPSISFE